MKKRLLVGVLVAVALAVPAMVYAEESGMKALCATFGPDSWEWYWFLCYLY